MNDLVDCNTCGGTFLRSEFPGHTCRQKRPRGRPWGEEVTTPKIRNEMRAKYKSGEFFLKEIAFDFGVSISTVRRAIASDVEVES